MVYRINFAITIFLKGWILLSQGLSLGQTSSRNLIFIPLLILKEPRANKLSLTNTIFFSKHNNKAGVGDYIDRGMCLIARLALTQQKKIVRDTTSGKVPSWHFYPCASRCAELVLARYKPNTAVP
jgi:hypothetical protein